MYWIHTINLQQQGATPHFALSVRIRLNELFPSRWIGREYPICPAPMSWPTADNSLSEFIKEKVRKNCFVTNDDIRAGVRTAFAPNYASDAATKAGHGVAVAYAMTMREYIVYRCFRLMKVFIFFVFLIYLLESFSCTFIANIKFLI